MLGSIRSMWVDLLGVADVGDDDDFFEVGGHSLDRHPPDVAHRQGARRPFPAGHDLRRADDRRSRRQGARGPTRSRCRARRGRHVDLCDRRGHRAASVAPASATGGTAGTQVARHDQPVRRQGTAVHRPRCRRQRAVPVEPRQGDGRSPPDLRVPGDRSRRSRHARSVDRGDGCPLRRRPARRARGAVHPRWLLGWRRRRVRDGPSAPRAR